VGGIDEGLRIRADLFRLDLATRRWERRAPMPTARDHLRMEAVGGQLFAISGREDDLRHNLATTERYDIATDTWTKVSDIPNARGGFGSAVANGHIYTFGGEYPWTCLEAVERYDPQTDRWELLGALPEARHGIIAAAIGNRIHLISGGRRPRVSVSAIHRVYEPAED
jgi:N-acetylneuraminic acid mutarotase